MILLVIMSNIVVKMRLERGQKMQILERLYLELDFVQKVIPRAANSIICHHATQMWGIER